MERTARDRSFAILASAFFVAALLGALSASPPAAAQQAGGSPSLSYDPSLRALQYYRYKRLAESGPERGRELYYFKCWQCHNEFQKTAPQLKGLYEGGRQIAGETGLRIQVAHLLDCEGIFAVRGCRGRSRLVRVCRPLLSLVVVAHGSMIARPSRV